MNTKNKIIAILMASLVAMAVGMPMAIGQNDDVTIGADVGNVQPSITCPAAFDVTPPLKTEGGPATTTFTIDGTIADDNGYGDIASVTCDAVAVMSAGSAVCTPTQTGPTTGDYSCLITIDRCTTPGPYTITVTVTDVNGVPNTCTVTVTIIGTIGLELDLAAVAFGAIAPGAYKEVAGDTVWDAAAGNLTVHSTGNTAIDINVASVAGLPCADAAQCGVAAIPEGNIDCDISGSLVTPLPNGYNVDIGCYVKGAVGLGITATGAGGAPLPKGPYSGTVTFTAVAG